MQDSNRDVHKNSLFKDILGVAAIGGIAFGGYKGIEYLGGIEKVLASKEAKEASKIITNDAPKKTAEEELSNKYQSMADGAVDAPFENVARDISSNPGQKDKVIHDESNLKERPMMLEAPTPESERAQEVKDYHDSRKAWNDGMNSASKSTEQQPGESERDWNSRMAKLDS